MSAIPKNFFPFVSELAEFSRNKLRINTQGAVSASPGDVTILTLPEGKLALDTSLGGFVTTSTSAGFAAVQSVEHLVEQYQVEFDGISVTPGNTFYNKSSNSTTIIKVLGTRLICVKSYKFKEQAEL